MLESQYFRTERPRKRHRRKAITGIAMGLAFSVWGCGHLSRHRGYPTYAAYFLFGLGLTIIGGLIAGLPGMLEAKTVGFIFVFATLVPAVVLMALPVKKDNRVHRRHRREQIGF